MTAALRILALLAYCHFQAAAAADAPALDSGFDLQDIDAAVRPQDDPYRYINGRWLGAFAIPVDKGSYDQFTKIADVTQLQLRALVEDLQRSADAADPDQRKLADLYADFMDESAADAAGLAPLTGELARIAAIRDRSQIPALIAHLNRIGVPAPYKPVVHQDAREATVCIVDLQQDGLGMPDRDYYLQEEAGLRAIRGRYLQHVQRMLGLAGDAHAARAALDIMQLETALAKVQWTKVANRDPVKVYNRLALDRLGALAPGYNWAAYLRESGVEGRASYLVVSQPGYMAGFNQLLRRTPLRVWKSYFRLRVLKAYAPYLGKAFAAENFAFDGDALNGTPENEARWQLGVELLDRDIGEALGRLYVARYFQAASRERVDRLVRNMLAAFSADIDALDWMGPETRRRAQEKLALITTKIGGPVRPRDYGALRIVRGDLVGNVMRASEFEYQRNIDRLGRPLDRTQWDMTAPTVNAYYNPELNEIVLPAGILQPPFFNAGADDAANYGGIGGIIGHEISHAFDDEGSQYDGHGNLLSPPGWFTPEDLRHFSERTHALVGQYSVVAPLPGFPINGELTLGENIADNSGLATAHTAYQLSLGGRPAPVIDGLTGEQRFYLGWAQSWRGKYRDNDLIMLIKSDPHSPDDTRGTLPLRNQAGYYRAFDVREGDRMYLAPDKRVSLW